MISDCARIILRLIAQAERAQDHGAYSLEGVGRAPILICSSLLDVVAADEKEIRAAVAELRAAGLVAPEAVRVQPHASSRLGLPVVDDLDGDGCDIRSMVVRILEDGPQREAEIARQLGTSRSGNLKRVLNRMYIAGQLAPPSSLWTTDEALGVALP